MESQLLQAILTYGPGGVIAALVIFGVLIPRSIHEREVKRADTATNAASQNADALKQVSDALRVSTDAIVALRGDVEDLREEVSSMKLELARRVVS